jgi:hypothetical protein
MNTKDLQFEGVSQNLRYIFTNKGIIQTGDYFNNKGNTLDYSFENLPFAIDILKEHREIYYKLNKISLTEYANSSRKFLYEVMDILQMPQQVTIIKEWENHFGDKLLLLNESVDKLLVESRVQESWDAIKYIIMEAWWNPVDWVKAAGKGVKNVYDWGKKQVGKAVDWTKEQGRQIKEKGFWQWTKDKVKNVYNSVKNAVVSAWNCLTNNFVECLMEGIRSAAFSAVGMGVMTFLSFIPGIGQVVDGVVFGSLLIWDVYKMLSGKYESGKYQWSWADIIIDAVCVLLPVLGNGLKLALRGVKTTAEIGMKAAKGGIVGKAVKAVIGGLSKVMGWISKGARWIGKKLGIQWLAKMGTKAEASVTKGVAEIETAMVKGETAVAKGETAVAKDSKGVITKTKEGVIKGGKDFRQFLKDGKLIKPMPYVLKSSGKTVLITAGLCAALGLDGWTCAHKAENGEISEDDLKAAQEALKSEESQAKLDALTDKEIEDIGLFPVD